MNFRRMAGAPNLLEAAWTLYAVIIHESTPTMCPLNECPQIANGWMITALIVVEVVLLLDSIVCFAGRWLGLPLGAALSILTIVFVAFQWGTLGAFNSGIAALLSAFALVLNVMAMMMRTRMPEESHPLNLPVFG